MQLGGSRPQGQREKEPWLGGFLQLLTPYHPICPGLVAWLPGCVSRGCHPDTHGSQKGVFAKWAFQMCAAWHRETQAKGHDWAPPGER